MDGKCSKYFPKDFNEETSFNKNSCVTYRRRNTEKMIERPNAYLVDNRHVVPYCPRLTLMFNCHINA